MTATRIAPFVAADFEALVGQTIEVWEAFTIHPLVGTVKEVRDGLIVMGAGSAQWCHRVIDVRSITMKEA